MGGNNCTKTGRNGGSKTSRSGRSSEKGNSQGARFSNGCKNTGWGAEKESTTNGLDGSPYGSSQACQGSPRRENISTGNGTTTSGPDGCSSSQAGTGNRGDISTGKKATRRCPN